MRDILLEKAQGDYESVLQTHKYVQAQPIGPSAADKKDSYGVDIHYQIFWNSL